MTHDETDTAPAPLRLSELDDDALLTRQQIARLTNVSVKTLANRESAGRPILPVVRVGGIPRYRVRDVKRLVRGELDPTPPAA